MPARFQSGRQAGLERNHPAGDGAYGQGGDALKPLPFEEALRIVLDSVKPIEDSQEVPLDDALGRMLAEGVRATMNTPPFDRASKDGYAVIAADTNSASHSNAITLEQTFTIFAGQADTKQLTSYQCIQVATGARIPPGADAVVMVEDTEKDDSQVKVFRAAHPGDNISIEGGDIEKGELVLKKGTMLGPGKIGVLASQGLTKVRVLRKPRVAVLPTGEEVAEVGGPLKEDQVYDINSHTTAVVVASSGGVAVPLGIAGDTKEKLREAISNALDNDMVAISGGSSVGERDLLFDILDEMGEVLFHGIQMKPGKPTLFAIVNDKPVLGMPGYPTSCLINAYLLLQPALRKLAGLPPKRTQIVEAKLRANVSGIAGRKMFLTVKLEGDTAIPSFKESGAITGTAEADGYIEIASDTDIQKGEIVKITLF